MKSNTTFTLLILSAVAHAGETMAPMPPQEPMSAPLCESSWFAGLGAEYLLDAEEMYYTGQFGYDMGCGHSLFLEAGWVQEDDSLGGFPFGVNVEVDVIPVTLNYKYEYAFTRQLGFYIGLGAGASYTDIEVSAGPVGASDDSWSFTAQAFAGLTYNVSENFSIYGGARYLWLDDPSVFGVSVGNLDDVGLGGGVRFKF
ncbi:outer membrane protein [Haloferula sargassicola]|uniref:Outer membrane protein beta-barrel domain-containing protein n=1 Tax=Haloferula sargassicola TaxID=490096 RepID=A0ABP9UMB4_9BACT